MYPNAVAVADFNGDNKADLVTANQGPSGSSSPGKISVLLGNGDGTFGSGTTFQAGVRPHQVATGDFNGDHIEDIAVVNLQDNTVGVFLGSGHGTGSELFSPQTTFQPSPYPNLLASGDFNGDGNVDLVVPENFAAVTFSLGDGHGSFTQLNRSVASGSGSLVTADLNGDKILDVAMTTNSTVTVIVGGKNISSAASYPLGANPGAVTAGDFDGDGKTDLLVTTDEKDGTTGLLQTKILLGNGVGSVSSPLNYPAALDGTSLAAGDFDGDGRLDFAAVDRTKNALAVALNSGCRP